jgi:signal transduction histidine kinase
MRSRTVRIDDTASASGVPRKWRPSVGLVVFLALAAVLALPLVGLFFFRIYENQIIHQTEAELIAQSAVIAAIMREDIDAQAPQDFPLGAAAEGKPQDETNGHYEPVPPSLDLAGDDLLGRRPEALTPSAPPSPALLSLGARLTPIILGTQRVTLAGFRVLDSRGIVIAGREELGLSLAHVEEVADALQGRFRSVMRIRISKHDPPPIYSLSRGTGVRVFTAMPVVARGHVVGVVYASRTPSNVFKSLYEERGKVVLAGFCIAALTLLIGYLFQRTITRPMRELMRRTTAIGRGQIAGLQPLARHGTAEFAQLSQGFLDMAASLNRRSDFIATFAAHVSHELKSPLTAIQGAVELLRDDALAPSAAMSENDRRRFLDNIIADAGRLTAIVQRLRELARADNPLISGATSLAPIVADLHSAFGALNIHAAGDLGATIGMSAENAAIIMGHLVDNSALHGATELWIEAAAHADELCVTVHDNGAGVSPNNAAKIFDNFFTTRRESGGTGMGLTIVRSMLEAHGGSIRLATAQGVAQGAIFELRFPKATLGV